MHERERLNMEEESWECPAPGCRQTFAYKRSATKHFRKVHPISAEAQRTVGERQSQRITEKPHAAQSADLRLRDSDVAVGLALRPGREPPAEEAKWRRINIACSTNSQQRKACCFWSTAAFT